MIRALITAGLLLVAILPARAMDIVEVKSEGGFTIWLVSESSIPMIALDIEFIGGASLDPVEQQGATNLMTGLLEEGSRDLDSVGFAAAREELAARFGYSASRDVVSISATMLSENREATINLLAGALVEPTFGDVAVERVKGQVLSNLRSEETDPNSIAGRAYGELTYGDHPYARSSDGTTESVAKLTRQDVVNAHRRTMVKSRAIVGVVGDISAEEVGPMIDRLLGGLPDDGPELPDMATINESNDVKVISLDIPQSVAIFGHAGIDRDDPDFMVAYLVSSILGGSGLDSRLKDEIREKRGLTYGVYSYLGSGRFGAAYVGSVASANENMGQVVELVRQEWTKMAEKGVSAEELARTKRYLTGAYPLRFTGNAQIAGSLVGLQLANLPIDYIDTRNDKMNAVTLEQVNAMARRLLKPDLLRFVIVGQPEGFPQPN